MGVKAYPIRVTTEGSAGAAVGSGYTEGPVRGEVLGVRLNFHGSTPATADTTLKTKGDSAASYNLLVVTNSATDGYFAPRVLPVTAANVAFTDAAAPYVVDDYLELAVAGADALTDAVVGHVYVRE